MGNRFGQSKLSRRSFTKKLVSGSLVIGFNSITGSWVTSVQAASESDFAKLPALDGTLHLDDETRAEYAQDYGQIIHEQPLAVLKPGSVEDIVRMVQFVRRYRLRIAARGQGHLPFGQAQVGGGVVIDMRSLQTVHALGHAGPREAALRPRQRVRFGAGYFSQTPIYRHALALSAGEMALIRFQENLRTFSPLTKDYKPPARVLSAAK